MRKSFLTASLVVVAFLCAGISSAAGPTVEGESGNLKVTFGESFAPKALSKTVPTPIALRLWSRIESIGGFPPPAVREFVFDADGNSAIDVRGLPTCSGGHRDVRELNPIRGCGNAIVGEGTANFDIQFPDSPSIPSKGKLIVYNDGVKAGVTTLFVFTYLTAPPITTTLLMPIRIEKIHEGGFATRAIVTVPTIANGYGSLASFSVRIGRSFLRRGKRVSVLTAKCPDGKIYARAKASFVDGNSFQSRLVRTCAPNDRPSG